MAPPGYRELRTGAVIVPLDGARSYWLKGRDWRQWLQGQVTNDVRQLTQDAPLDFCLTKPTGQILAVCRAWEYRDIALVSVIENDGGRRSVSAETQDGGRRSVGAETQDGGRRSVGAETQDGGRRSVGAGSLEERVQQTVILEDVSSEPTVRPLLCIQGPNAPDHVPRERFPSDRTGSGGFEFFGQSTIQGLSREAYDLCTLESGIPILGVDTDETTLPPELGDAFDQSHVSYQKGCYTGQEVLMRIRSRGHTNKSWVGLKTKVVIDQGTPVEVEGKVVGRIQRAAFSLALGPIASATLRNVAAQPGTVVMVGGTKAKVCEMPFLR